MRYKGAPENFGFVKQKVKQGGNREKISFMCGNYSIVLKRRYNYKKFTPKLTE